jgi:serine/threonine protein kinase
MAPETHSGKYGTQVDVWASGVVLYRLMTFEALRELPRKIVNKQSELEHHKKLRHALEVAILLILTKRS